MGVISISELSIRSKEANAHKMPNDLPGIMLSTHLVPFSLIGDILE